jgi:hypothetical protein
MRDSATRSSTLVLRPRPPKTAGNWRPLARTAIAPAAACTRNTCASTEHGKPRGGRPTLRLSFSGTGISPLAATAFRPTRSKRRTGCAPRSCRSSCLVVLEPARRHRAGIAPHPLPHPITGQTLETSRPRADVRLVPALTPGRRAGAPVVDELAGCGEGFTDDAVIPRQEGYGRERAGKAQSATRGK